MKRTEIGIFAGFGEANGPGVTRVQAARIKGIAARGRSVRFAVAIDETHAVARVDGYGRRFKGELRDRDDRCGRRKNESHHAPCMRKGHDWFKSPYGDFCLL